MQGAGRARLEPFADSTARAEALPKVSATGGIGMGCIRKRPLDERRLLRQLLRQARKALPILGEL